MNYEHDIKTLLTIGENIVIEFKRAGNGPEHDTYESICAFLNRQGGDVLLGRADELGSGVRNLYHYVKLYSGADPIFDEKDVFRLTVPLNADYSPETGLVTTVKTTRKTTRKGATRKGTTRKIVEERLRELIGRSPTLSLPELASELEMTTDGVYYHINALKKAGKLKRIGGRKSGHWEFVSTSEQQEG